MRTKFLKYFLRGLPMFILLILVMAMMSLSHDVLGWISRLLPVPNWSQSLISVGLSVLIVLALGWVNPIFKILSRFTFMRFLTNSKKYPPVLVRISDNWLFGLMTERLDQQEPNEMFKTFVPNVPIPASGYPLIVPLRNIRFIKLTWSQLFHQIATAGFAPLGGKIELKDGQPPLD